MAHHVRSARPLPVVAISLLLGSLTGAAAAYLPLSSFIGTVGLLGVLIVLVVRRHYSAIFACLLFGVFLSGAVLATLAQARSVPLIPPDTSRSQKLDLIGEIMEPVRYGPDHAAVVVSLQRIVLSQDSIPAKGRVRLHIRGNVPSLIVGDILRFQTRLRAPHSQMNPGSFDYAAYLRQHGIQAMGNLTLGTNAEMLRILGHTSHPLFDVIDRWRGHLREVAMRSLDAEGASLYLALITGESGYLSQDTRDVFMASGTTHILSISGSHLGLITIVIFGVIRGAVLLLPAGWLLRLTVRMTPARVAAAATIPLVTFYAVLGGAEVATVRSLLMLGIFLGGVLINRTHNLAIGLALALLIIVYWDPMAPLDLSFQLSFLSVLVIVWLAQRHREAAQAMREDLVPPPPSTTMFEVFRKWTWETVVVTLAITVMTAPLVALHFRQIAWVGPAANLVIVPLVGFGIVPLSLLAGLATLLSGSESLWGASLLQAAFDFLLWVVHGFAALPAARWMVASPPVWQVVLFYLCVANALCCSRQRWAVRCTLGVTVALLALWIWSPRDLPAAGTLRATFLDVGQGDAAVIETSTGEVMIIDGGSRSDALDQGRAVVAPYLWDRGIRRVDVVVATHPQLDHVGGLAWIVREFPIGEFWTNGTTREAAFMQRLNRSLKARDVRVKAVSTQDPAFAFGRCYVRIQNPEPFAFTEFSRFDGKHLNNQSVVTRIECGQTTMLFTGDIEQEAEARLVAAGQLQAGVLKVPHHGSRGSLHEPFLRAVNPYVAIVSAGRDNSYGHPATAMLEMYRRLNIAVLRTDRDGAITVVQSDRGQLVGCEARRRLLRIRPSQKDVWSIERENWLRMWRLFPACAPTASLTSTS